MKGAQVILGRLGARKAAALMRDGRLDDLLVDPAGDVPGPGAIFRAVCDRPVKGQGGMFLRLGDGRTGFFRGAKGLAPGQVITVQATGVAETGKAIPVADRILFKSRYCIVTPGAPGLNVARSIRDEAERDRLELLAHDVLPEARHGMGAILRSACAGAPAAAVVDDLTATWALASQVMGDAGDGPELLVDAPDAHELAWREWADVADVSEAWDAVADQVDALSDPIVPLGQVSLSVEPTRALVAVDVNTADASPAGGLKANIAAARELPRQLRLRGLSGQIVVDCAPMPKKDRRTFESALRAALRADPVETSLIGWTPLGHYELTRRRERPPLMP